MLALQLQRAPLISLQGLGNLEASDRGEDLLLPKEKRCILPSFFFRLERELQ